VHSYIAWRMGLGRFLRDLAIGIAVLFVLVAFLTHRAAGPHVEPMTPQQNAACAARLHIKTC
jgi:hypothetical protein